LAASFFGSIPSRFLLALHKVLQRLLKHALVHVTAGDELQVVLRIGLLSENHPFAFHDSYLLSLSERGNLLSLFGNGFSKKLDNHVAAVALYVAHYNLCRVHKALRMTPAKALGVADRNWSIGELIDAALATQPIAPVPTPPERRKLFNVIPGGKE
jgi:hypothetical protein